MINELKKRNAELVRVVKVSRVIVAFMFIVCIALSWVIVHNHNEIRLMQTISNEECIPDVSTDDIPKFEIIEDLK